jgi:PAS domain S-box-containing protein
MAVFTFNSKSETPKISLKDQLGTRLFHLENERWLPFDIFFDPSTTGFTVPHRTNMCILENFHNKETNSFNFNLKIKDSDSSPGCFKKVFAEVILSKTEASPIILFASSPRYLVLIFEDKIFTFDNAMCLETMTFVPFKEINYTYLNEDILFLSNRSQFWIVKLLSYKPSYIFDITKYVNSSEFLHCIHCNEYVLVCEKERALLFNVDTEEGNLFCIIPVSGVRHFYTFKSYVIIVNASKSVCCYDSSSGSLLYNYLFDDLKKPDLQSMSDIKLLYCHEHFLLAVLEKEIIVWDLLDIHFYQLPFLRFSLPKGKIVNASSHSHWGMNEKTFREFLWLVIATDDHTLEKYEIYKWELKVLKEKANQKVYKWTQDFRASKKIAGKGTESELVAKNDKFIELILKKITEDYGNKAAESFCLTDARHRSNPLIYVNKEFTELTGYTPEDCIGKNCKFLQGPLQDPEEIIKLNYDLSHNKRHYALFLNYKKDGTPFYNSLLIQPVFKNAQKKKIIAFFALQNNINQIMFHTQIRFWIESTVGVWLFHDPITKPYAQIFINKEINGEKLIKLTSDDMLAMNIPADIGEYIFNKFKSALEIIKSAQTEVEPYEKCPNIELSSGSYINGIKNSGSNPNKISTSPTGSLSPEVLRKSDLENESDDPFSVKSKRKIRAKSNSVHNIESLSHEPRLPAIRSEDERMAKSSDNITSSRSRSCGNLKYSSKR